MRAFRNAGECGPAQAFRQQIATGAMTPLAAGFTSTGVGSEVRGTLPSIPEVELWRARWLESVSQRGRRVTIIGN